MLLVALQRYMIGLKACGHKGNAYLPALHFAFWGLQTTHIPACEEASTQVVLG